MRLERKDAVGGVAINHRSSGIPHGADGLGAGLLFHEKMPDERLVSVWNGGVVAVAIELNPDTLEVVIAPAVEERNDGLGRRRAIEMRLSPLGARFAEPALE